MIDLEGKQAPDFTLAGSDGTTHTLTTYRGRYVVLYFYPKDNTPGCTKESCGFRDLNDQFKDLNTTILGISKDHLDSHNTFIADFKLPFVLLSDPHTEMMATYGAWGEKVLYGKKSIGCIRSTVIIDPTGKVVKHWKRVPKAETHPAKVFEVIEQLTTADQ